MNVSNLRSDCRSPGDIMPGMLLICKADPELGLLLDLRHEGMPNTCLVLSNEPIYDRYLNGEYFRITVLVDGEIYTRKLRAASSFVHLISELKTCK